MPPDSSNSQPPTPRSCTTPHSSTRPECGYVDPCATTEIDAKNRKRDGTECGAALDKEGKHATTCPCGHALSARHNALRDDIANIARRTGLCADIETLVDHPAIDPENGARTDVRVSKPGVQNPDELIDVQVTSPFCVEAAGLVGKAASIAESKKRTKYRPAVVTPAILETDGRMGPTLEAFLSGIAPGRPASTGHLVTGCHEADLLRPADSQRAPLRQVPRLHLTPSPSPLTGGPCAPQPHLTASHDPRLLAC